MKFKGTRFPDHDEVQSAQFCAVAAAVVGATLVTGAVTANQQKKAAQGAANAQSASAQQGIDAQERQFQAISEMLAPYRLGGEKALSGQQDLIGQNGNDAQLAAIQALQGSPQFTSALKMGENSILQNASATGGLRGGDTQGALAEFSPQLLAQTINDQYGRLGGIATMGQNAAAQTGGFGQQSTNNVTNLLQQQGAARAGQAIANGKANAGLANTFGNAFGSYMGGKF